MDHRVDFGGGGFEHLEGALMHPGRKVSVLGLGKSGVQGALFLKKRGYEVFASESADHESARGQAEMLRSQGVEAETGTHSAERILTSDWVLISPGISPKTPIYQTLLRAAKPVFSEIEVASWFCQSKRILAVTGSSGKTTVATLLARVLEASGAPTLCCGNIGNPWIGELERIVPETSVVLEISSFQLQQCFSFRPHTAILLNISPNHLDWHRDMKDYAGAKFRIFQNQRPGDFAFLRREDMENFFPEFKSEAEVCYFDLDLTGNPNEGVIRKVAARLGIRSDAVDRVLADFSGLEHRLERVAEFGGVTFVNDSKATTTAALAWALEKYADRSVCLIAGGIAKSADYHTIRELIRRKVRKVCLMGDAAPVLEAAWGGAAPIYRAGNLADALSEACAAAGSSGTVLLSPACSSFDMFKNYQERGRIFKELVQARISGKSRAEAPSGVGS